MNTGEHRLLLADDDADDCIFFKEILEELPVNSTLTIVNDGVELMHFLDEKKNDLPDILFLDLNMPKKTGYECLLEIKLNKDLKDLPVIIFSTSMDPVVVNLLYEKGAHYYIRKPGDFAELKQVIYKALSLMASGNRQQPVKEKFVLK